MHTALRRDLASAIKSRDRITIAALRSALSAIANAEAADAPDEGPKGAQSAHVAGSVAGLGAAEVPRRELSDDDVAELVRAEVRERQAAAAEYERAGQGEQASRLRAEADVLLGYLPDA